MYQRAGDGKTIRQSKKENGYLIINKWNLYFCNIEKHQLNNCLYE